MNTRTWKNRIVSMLLAMMMVLGVFPMQAFGGDYSTCGIPEHVHTDECYGNVLTCDKEESEEHTHTDECYSRVLSCGMQEHVHTEACYEKAEAEASENPDEQPVADVPAENTDTETSGNSESAAEIAENNEAAEPSDDNALAENQEETAESTETAESSDNAESAENLEKSDQDPENSENTEADAPEIVVPAKSPLKAVKGAENVAELNYLSIVFSNEFDGSDPGEGTYHTIDIDTGDPALTVAEAIMIDSYNDFEYAHVVLETLPQLKTGQTLAFYLLTEDGQLEAEPILRDLKQEDRQILIGGMFMQHGIALVIVGEGQDEPLQPEIVDQTVSADQVLGTDGQPDDATTVEIKGNLPSDVKVSVQAVELISDAQTPQASSPAVGTAEVSPYEKTILAFDITLSSQGAEYQPQDGPVEVTIDNPAIASAFEDGWDLAVWHIAADGTEEQIDNEKVTVEVSNEDPENPVSSITFEAESFSVYEVRQTILEQEGQEITASLAKSNGNVSSILWANDDIYLTGKMPGNGIVEATRVEPSVGGKDALVAYDINIYANEKQKTKGITWQPSGKKVQVNIKSDALVGKTAVDVYHIGSDNAAGLVASEVSVQESSVTFEAESFSVYVIIDHEGGEVKVPRVEFHFIAGTTATPDTSTEPGQALYSSGPYTFRNKSDDTDAGKTQASMIVRDGDTLESIEAPAEIGDSVFFGWYTVNMRSDSTIYNSSTHTYSGQIVYSWPDDTQRVELDNTISITDVVKNGNGAVTSLTWTVNGVSQTVTTNIDEDGCAHVYLAPIYTNYNFVNFHLAPFGDSAAAYIMTRKLIVLGNSATTDIRIGDIKSSYQDPSYYRFVGWQYLDDKGTADTSDDIWVNILTVNDNDAEINNAPPKVGTYLAAEGHDYDLYPIFVQIRWITFNRGAAHNGSDYLAPQYIRTSDSGAGTFTVSGFYGKTTAKRVGYDFKGWYLNACFGTGNTFLNESAGAGGYNHDVEINGENVTVHYGQIIQLTDENGSFVSAVRGKDFYAPVETVGGKETYNNNDIRMVASGATAPANCVKVFSVDASGNLSVYTGIHDRLPVYAKWEPQASAKYKVVIWMQKSTDSADAVNVSQHDTWVSTYKTNNPIATTEQAEAAWDAACKHYDFYDYNTRTAAGGTTVSPNATDLGYAGSGAFIGFQRGEYDQNVTVDPQGTTVLNVYYDRIVRTLTFQDHPYSATTSNNGTQYGLVDGQYVRIYYRNGAWRLTNANNGTVYTGTRYRQGNNWTTVKTISAIYGHNISDQFPIVGTNGMTYSGYVWEPQSSSVFTTGDVGYIDTMQNENTTFRAKQYGTYVQNHIYYYVEALPGENNTVTYDGKQFVEYQHLIITAEDGIDSTESEEFSDITGYTQYKSDPAYGNNGKVTLDASNNYTIKLYYTRNTYSVTFMPNYPGEVDTSDLTQDTQQPYAAGLNGSEKKTFVVENIPYGMTISDSSDIAAVRALQGSSVEADSKYPLIPNEHQFDGWFVDASASVKYNFDSTMPAGNVVVYAGWSMIKYRVIIDPNGGVMDHINYPNYKTMLDKTGLKTTASYNNAFATYFNNTASEFIVTDSDIDNPMVKINNAEAARRVSAGDPVYRYVNMQYTKAETLNGGIYASYAADARNALYILDTPESITQYYNYYCQVLADMNDGTPIAPQSTWESLYLSAEKYRPLETGESYTFLGWYEYFEETGELDDEPFDFSQPTSHRTYLVAQWRLDGGYMLQYHPDYVFVDTDSTEYTLTGSMVEFYDPDPDSVDDKYADGATTQAMEEPAAIKINGVPDNEGLFQFRGWQIVRVAHYGGTDHYEVPDEEVGVYYTAGQTITVHGRYAQEQLLEDGVTSVKVIHLRAVYEKRDDAYRRPDIINLTIDAGQDGTLDTNGDPAPVGQGYVNTSDSTSLPAWTYPGHQYISETTKAVEIESVTQQKPYQILIGDAQSNTALHLYKYATLLTKSEVTGAALDPAGQLFFTHPAGYKLIGFDLDAPDKDFIPDYPADAVIAVSPNESHTLYAVWEPMVYITFKNSTGVDAEPVTIHLSGTNRAMYVVSKTNGSFSRQPVDTSKDIVIANGDSITFVMPYGAGENLTVTGTNNLGTGYMLSANSVLGTTSPVASATMTGSLTGSNADYTDVQNGNGFGFTETLLTHPEGLVVTFTATKADHTLVLHDNLNGDGTGGGRKEFNFKENVSGVVYYGTEDVTSFGLPTTSTRLGFELLGWDESPTATDPTYKNGNWTISTLTAFFASSGTTPADIEVKDLYAIWKPNSEASTVYVWKEVPEPGDQTKEFTFTVSFSGGFGYTQSRRTGNWYNYNYDWGGGTGTGTIGAGTAYGTPRLTYDFTLTHNQYLKIITSQQVTNGTRPYLTMTVQKWQHYTDGTPDVQLDADSQTSGTQNEVVLSWYWSNETRETATAQNQYTSFHFDGLEMSVTEDDYTAYYDLDVEAATGTEWNLNENDAGHKAYWDNTFAGGTVVFHNTRKTADVTITKTLLPATLEAENFQFAAEFTNGTDATHFEGYELTTASRFITSGTGTWKIEGVPTGAQLKITETVDSNRYETSAAGTSSAAVADLDAAANIFEFELADDTAVKFTNTLKQKNIRIVLVDDETPTPNKLGGGTFTLPGVFDGTNIASSVAATKGQIYEGVAYVGSYTFTQHTAPGDIYRKLQSTATINITGADGSGAVTATTGAGDTIEVSYDSVNDVYTITVVNPKLMRITVKKLIDANSSFLKTGTFGFTATLKDSSNAPIQAPNVIGTRGTDANGQITFTLVNNQEETLYVPRNAKLVVAEAPDAAFKTEYQTGDDEADAVLAAKTESNTVEISSVTEDGFILFTNTLKTITVRVNKTVVGKPETFNFTAFLRFNGAAIRGYTLATGIVTGDGSGSVQAGYANFTLTPASVNGTAFVDLEIPSGSVLVLTEESNIEFIPGYEVKDSDNAVISSAENALSVTLTDVQTVKNLTVTFTNTEVLVAPTGVDLHFRPFIMMGGLGALMYLVSAIGRGRKRRRKA